MARWLLLAAAAALWAGAGAGYADYSAARMPQYDSVNYDSRPVSPPAEDYRDRPVDVPASIDYNNYDQESNVKKRPKAIDEEETWQMPLNDNNVMSETVTTAIDEGESEYNYRPENFIAQLRYNKKRTRNISRIKANELFTRRAQTGRNPRLYPHIPIDDEDTEASTERFEEEKDLDSDSDKSKFVRRDIRQKNRRKFDYGEQRDARQLKNEIKGDDPIYTDQDPQQNAPSVGAGDKRPVRPQNRLSADTTGRDDSYERKMSSSRLPSRYKAPMPQSRNKVDDYVDYNDMSRIEKIKSLSSRRPTAKPGAQRWSHRDSFRRFYQPLQDEASTEAVTIANTDSATTTVNTRSPSPTSKNNFRGPISALPQLVIDNITDFVNRTKQLSIAEKSQLSILKKAQRKDSVKDEMLKNKPPVLLQVTERLQTVVMVEPPVSKEPWVRARDIAEDSPERIEKVKRFMRNKLVANARNISELMENWDDTVCDYVDISLLDERSGSVSVQPNMTCQLLFVICVLVLFS